MKKLYILGCFLLIQYLNFAQNVLISNTYNPNESSIMMDPMHPNVIVAASNINQYHISLDTGRTWTNKGLNSTFGVWGDPCIAVDTLGDFYFFHLSNPSDANWIDRIVCQKTSDQGNTWTDGTYTGLNGEKNQDKHWVAIDRKNNLIYVTWTQFDNYGSSSPLDSTIILFSKSLDLGMTWSEPRRISKYAGDCIDSGNTVEGAVPCVGTNGEIYVSWAGPKGLVFNKSLDQGETWLNEEMVINSIPGGWDFDVSGINRANGLPITSCDLSNGPNRGTIYVNWSDQRNGLKNTDIWLVKSTDQGKTWTAPTLVNDDNTDRHQFFTWMTIDQTSGNLYFVFYDRRNYTNDLTDVYLAISNDGGNTFVNKKISESPFQPNRGVFFGDYTNITAHNGIVRPIWTRLDESKLSIWTHLANASQLLSSAQDETHLALSNAGFENYPNPSQNLSFVSYKIRKPSLVNLDITDEKGHIVANVLNQVNRNYGKYVEEINFGNLGLISGIYFIQLTIDGVVKTNRQVVVK